MSEKLTSIQTRIESLRIWLETNEPYTSMSHDGMSITVDRAKVMEELQNLELEEKKLTGKSRWIRKIDLS